MQTNKTISKDTKLYRKGQALLDAAYDYWKEYQKECGSAAVVYLEANDGHFILFTRSEYKGDFLRAMNLFAGEPVMEHPFDDGDPV